jgi:ketosteroid isomerase-like protein
MGSFLREEAMSDPDGGTVVQKFFQAMNDHDLDQVVAVASEDIEFVDVAGGEEIYGHEQDAMTLITQLGLAQA